MKHCNHCNIDVETTENYCPLCYNYFDVTEDNSKTEEVEGFDYYMKRSKTSHSMRSNHFVAKLFAYISICAIVGCIAINYFFSKAVPWSFIVVCSVAYLWILIAHTIISDRSPFEKIFFQLIALLLLLYSTNFISKGSWLCDYVIPSIMLAATTALVMISLISKNKATYILPFFIFYIIFSVVSLVFLLFFKDVYQLLNLINVFYTGLIAVGTLIFGNKILKAEVAKKAHL